MGDNKTNTEKATGSAAPWRKDRCRIVVTLPEATFESVKISALQQNRSLSAEILTRVQRSIKTEQGDT